MNEANEVMQCSRFVVNDLEEEMRNDLPNYCEVGVGQLPGNQLNYSRELANSATISLGVIVSEDGVIVVFGVRCHLWGLI